MNNIENLAWSILTLQEQNSLSLSLSHGLSTWEAGEILNLSHYKYLEIKERSEKFFKLFIDYFNTVKSESIIHPQSVMDPRFRDYIEACIEKRMGRLEASSYTGDSSLIVPSIHSKHIIKNMDRLKKSPIPQDQSLFSLIMEFDRWNNKRILPRVIQMPSAYKRRVNKRDKLYIKYISNVPDNRIENMLSLFTYNPKKDFKKRFYICLISEELFQDGYSVIQVKDDKATLERLTKLYIYIFKKEDHADIFGFLVSRFKSKTNKSRSGQQYWPEYRETVSRAINFSEINNIHFYAEDLEKAYNGMGLRKNKEPKPNRGAKRAPEKLFE